MEACISIFELATGAKRNRSKTVFLRLNDSQNRLKSSLLETGIMKEATSTDLLGFPISISDVPQRDVWEDILVKTKTACDIWSSRGLSGVGRSMILNAKLASKLVYRLGLYEMSPTYLRKFEDLFKRFLFGGGRAWCSSDPWHLPKRLGGLGLINIADMNTALLAKIAFTYLNGPTKTWVRLAHLECGPSLDQILLKPDAPLAKVPLFWMTVRKAAQKVLLYEGKMVLEWPDISRSLVGHPETFESYDRHPLSVSELFHLPFDAQGSKAIAIPSPPPRVRISKEKWSHLQDHVRSSLMKHIRAPLIQVTYGPGIKRRRLTFETRRGPFLWVCTDIKYSTKEGRRRLALRKSQENQACHSHWTSIIGSRELKALSDNLLPRFYPGHIQFFLWRLRHLALFHFPYACDCTLCGTSQASIDHILADCPAIQEVWATVEASLGRPVDHTTRIFGPIHRFSPLWKHRLFISITAKHLWDAYWLKKTRQAPFQNTMIAEKASTDATLYALFYP